MEIALPFLTLSALYVAHNQKSKDITIRNATTETFAQKQKLPNTNTLDQNYPEKKPLYVGDAEVNSAEISQTNRYDGGTPYTDKYFNPSLLQKRRIEKEGRTEREVLENEQKTFISLTGEKVSADYFRHNNEQPFFGSRTKGGNANDHHDAILDMKTGDGTYYKRKVESAPLFQPTKNISYTFGMPSQTEFIQNRQQEVVSLKQNGIPLNQPQTVARGLGLGGTNEGSGGFNSSLNKRELFMDRNVDELRNVNNPKSTEFMLYGHEGTAKLFNSKINDQSVIGQMNKNRPENYYENSPSRYLVAKASHTAPTVNGIIHDRHTTRETQLTSYVGVANAEQLKATHSFEIYGNCKETNRQELGEYPLGVASATGMGNAREEDYDRNGIYFANNNRSFREKDDTYYGGVSGAMGAVVAPLMDTLRPTRKENYIGTSRPFQNPASKVPSSYLYDTQQKLPTTNRELYEDNTFAGHINTTQTTGLGYLTNEMEAPPTMKQQTLTSYFGGSTVPTRIAKNSEGELYNVDRVFDKKPTAHYTPSGKIDTFNSNINMEIKNNSEYLLRNNRQNNGFIRGQIPNTNTLGVNTLNSNNYQQDIHLQRNDGSVLTSLKNNPFAHNVVGAW